MKKNILLSLFVAAMAVVVFVSPVFADQVIMHGATTVIDRLITPHKDAVEKKTGHKLEIVGNGTGKGLVDLVEGRAETSLCSEPLVVAAEAAKVAGKQVDIKKLQFAVVMNDEIVFVVHPANPVSSLTWEQLRDIHTGKIKNWKEVGGNSAPITVYTDTVTGGTRALIRHDVMGGQNYSSTVIPLTTVKKVGDMVAADPNGVGGLGKGFLDTQRMKLVQTKKVDRPLGFITIGAPSAKVSAVIDAFKAEAGKGGK